MNEIVFGTVQKKKALPPIHSGKKALPPIHSGSEGLPVPRCWPERQSFSQDFGCPCPTAKFCNGTIWLKIKIKDRGKGF